MTQVDFYILSTDNPSDGSVLACKVAEKAFQAGHRIYIQAESNEAAARLNDLLWTFKQGSFVPHNLVDSPESSAAAAPVLIGHATIPDDQDDVLINLTDGVPASHSRFKRIAEIIHGDEQRRAAARQRYRFYRENGCRLDSHSISA